MAYSRPGRSQAGNLSGLLGSIGDTIGEMGAPGEQYVDTFRRSMAPESDMNDADSLLNYADWAKRNGYEDEAKTYLALGYKQKAKQDEKAYKSTVAEGTQKLRGFNESIANLQVAAKEGDPAAEIALEKVMDARRQHIFGMNDYGKGNDYGIGDEGTKSSMALQAEVIAADKAALQRRELLANIQTAEMDLSDAVAKGIPIKLSSLPPNMRDMYEQEVRRAQEGPRPGPAMREVNERFRPVSSNYLQKRAEGDPATKQLLWSAVKNVRQDVDSDVAEWMTDPDSQEAINRAVETAEAQLLSDNDYLLASPEKQAVMAQDAIVKVLRGQRADLDELYSEAEKEGAREIKSQEARAKRVTEDRNMKYDAGMEPGGDEYKRARANAEKAKGENFDPEAFDASWDRRFFNPWGATAMPAPVY